MDISLLILAFFVASAAAFPEGAPKEVCTKRIPNHGFDPQESSCPFDIVALGWVAGEFTNMGIFPTEEGSKLEFKGFLISVYHNGVAIGEMKAGKKSNNIPKSVAVKSACKKTSLTHANSNAKQEVFFQWKAPAGLPDSVEVDLRLTIVEAKATFWVDCSLIKLGSLAANPVVSSSTSSTSTTTAAGPGGSAGRKPSAPAPDTRSQNAPPPVPETTQAPKTQSPAPTQPRRGRPPITTQAPKTQPPAPTQPRQTRSPVTTQAPQTQPPAPTRPRQTRPPVTTQAPKTQPPAPTRPRRTRPPVTTQAPKTQPPAPTRPQRTRPPAPTQAPRTQPPAPSRPRRTSPPVTTQAPRTQPPAPTRPRRTRPPAPTQAPKTQRPAPTQAPRTRPPAPHGKPSGNGKFDSYLDYGNKAVLKHKMMSDSECMEYGNTFNIVPGSDCREFTQRIIGTKPRPNHNVTKCPGGTRFDPRVCSCAFTTYCPGN